MKTKILIIVLIISLVKCCQSHEIITIDKLADTTKITSHLTNITKTDKPRNYKNLSTLNFVADYIYKEFKTYADTTYYQKYDVKGNEYKNVISIFGSENEKTIVVGAHYDVAGNQQGADDNASGTVALLELARMLKGQKLNYRIELVAYTLEEPPFFRTKQMGSYIHAKSMKDNKVDLYGMVCLEMIGFFDDAKNSQTYPLSILKLIFGNKANYITMVNKFGKGKFARKFSNQFKSKKLIKTKNFISPASLQGVDFSDHLNYWKFGYSAVMITDTSFYRNENYHKKTDTMDTLNIPKMASVITSVYLTLINLK